MAGRDNRTNRKREERSIRKAHQNIRRQKEISSSYFTEDDNFAGFANQLSAMGLKLRDIPGDGNCLFRALADQLEGSSNQHLAHREQTVKYMTEHRDDFEPFIEDDCSFDDHVRKLRLDGTYAGNDAIVAFARSNNVNVVIHQLNTQMWTINGNDRPTAQQLHISYHNGDHYSSVRKIGDNSDKPANIKLVVKTDNRPSSHKRDAKRKQNSPGSSNKKMTQQIVNVTGCQDLKFVQKTLEENDFNVEVTIGLVLKHMHSESSEEESQNQFENSSSRGNSLWEEEGTGTRIFGTKPQQTSKESARRRNNVPSKKISNKNRKEQARRDRKKRSDDRKKNSPHHFSHSDSDESSIVVKTKDVLKI